MLNLWFLRTEIVKGIESMRTQNLLVCAAIFTATLFTANLGFAQAPARGQARGQAKADDKTDPRTARFGVWDNSTNPNNVMTYEATRKAAASPISAIQVIRPATGVTS